MTEEGLGSPAMVCAFPPSAQARAHTWIRTYGKVVVAALILIPVATVVQQLASPELVLQAVKSFQAEAVPNRTVHATPGEQPETPSPPAPARAQTATSTTEDIRTAPNSPPASPSATQYPPPSIPTSPPTSPAAQGELPPPGPPTFPPKPPYIYVAEGTNAAIPHKTTLPPAATTPDASISAPSAAAPPSGGASVSPAASAPAGPRAGATSAASPPPPAASPARPPAPGPPERSAPGAFTGYANTSEAFYLSNNAAIPRAPMGPPEAEESYHSLGHVAPFVGDLKEPGAMDAMLRSRSYNGEIIGFYSTGNAWAGLVANLVLNLRRHRMAHYIVVMNTERDCGLLLATAPSVVDSCAWQSGPMDAHDPFFGANSRWGVVPLLNLRYYFIWRCVSKGVNTLWLDTDTYFTQSPYPELKRAVAERPPAPGGAPRRVNVFLKEHGRAANLEVNTGIMYVQDAAPSGPAARLFREAFLRYRFAHEALQAPGGKRPVASRLGHSLVPSAFEQWIVSDVILSSLPPCQPLYHFQMKEGALSPAAVLGAMLHLLEHHKPAQIGCGEPGGRREYLQIATDRQFGWKEAVWDAAESALLRAHPAWATGLRNGSRPRFCGGYSTSEPDLNLTGAPAGGPGGGAGGDQAAAGGAEEWRLWNSGRMREAEPAVVHVRDMGGHVGDKFHRLMQMGQWADEADHLAHLGAAHRLALGLDSRGRQSLSPPQGAVLQLEGLGAAGVGAASELLDLVEMFVRVAVVARRVPLLPWVPCQVAAALDWPPTCENLRKAADRWYIVAADPTGRWGNASEGGGRYRCSLNTLGCSVDVLEAVGLEGVLQPFYTSGEAFRARFPALHAPTRVAIPGGGYRAGLSLTSAALQRLLNADTSDNVAISALDMPANVTDLSEEDKALYKGLLDQKNVVPLMKCLVAKEERWCKKLQDKATTPDTSHVHFFQMRTNQWADIHLTAPFHYKS